jgi:dimeric dUTPase (all-alpha-NTP-PPase superfamily)
VITAVRSQKYTILLNVKGEYARTAVLRIRRKPMNLDKLFHIQKELNQKIVDRHDLHGDDLLPNLILALQVELGELANETRCFKHWSVKPPSSRERQLEEYSDGLAFILCIGLIMKIPDEWETDIFPDIHTSEDIVYQFLEVNKYIHVDIDNHDWFDLTGFYLGLGNILGFTREEIEQAYLEKNKVNHERQEHGY